MKLLELHILQSYPVSCLNRDDVGAPKSAVFGGVTRARISSQCLKRAIRRHATREFANLPFAGLRSRFLAEPFAEALKKHGTPDGEIENQVAEIIKVFSKPDSKHPEQVTTAVFLSPGEIDHIAKSVAGGESPAQAAKKAQRLDAADISIFGRMVANDATLNVEGAAQFSHALSVHQAENEIDFFSAVDDRKGDADDAGASMIGTLEFTSALYYRYCALNLNILADADHLGPLETEKRREVVDAFIRGTLLSVPSARQNSMNASTLPAYVLGIAKDKGQPVQLVNAYEAPVSSGAGYRDGSIRKLRRHLANQKRVWNLEHATEIALAPDGSPEPSEDEAKIEETDLQQFCTRLTAHVI